MASIVTSLRPYPGVLVICHKRKDFYREHAKRFGEPHEKLGSRSGRMVGRYVEKDAKVTYIVWAKNPAIMAHEISHVILDVFEDVGIDPVSGNGEPFCYLLSQLMIDAGHG